MNGLAVAWVLALAGVNLPAPDPVHLVGLGGAVGAVCRHAVYVRVAGDRFPWPTLAVNVGGSVLLGLLLFAGAGDSAYRLVGVGACGAFTTFSTFSVETVGLWDRGDRSIAITNAGANLLGTLLAIGLAWLLVNGPG